MEGIKMSSGHVTRIVGKEGGFALVIALLVMLVGTAIGIFGVSTGVIETRISGYERESTMAFYQADRSRHFAHDIINDAIDESGNPQYAPLPFVWDGGGDEEEDQRLVIAIDNLFYAEIMGDPDEETYDDTYGDTVRTSPASPDITITVERFVEEKQQWVVQKKMEVDVDSKGSSHGAGGGIEFLSGYDGIGSGGSAAGGAKKIFTVESLGSHIGANGSPNARCLVTTVFRRVNTGGGS